MYALCPHCGYPAVVSALEADTRRYCRQCRGRFIPAEHTQARNAARAARLKRTTRLIRRAARTLRAQGRL